MGSSNNIAYMNGNQDEQKTQGRFFGRRRRAYNACVAKIEAEIEAGEYERSDYDELLSSALQYSDSYTTVTGLGFCEERFDSTGDLKAYMFRSEDGVTKWESAMAARVRLTQEEATREGVALDEDGYAWAICAILAC